MKALIAFCVLGAYAEQVRLTSDVAEAVVLTTGGTIATIVLKSDPLNPLWEPDRPGAGRGHFLCLDGFGAPSQEERAAGMEGHGEAVRQEWKIASRSADSVTLETTLPLVQEKITRSYRLRGSILKVRTRVESLLAIDRPIAWAEHATIGSPFLERAVTRVSQSSTRSIARPWTERNRRRLASGAEFTWPNAPLADGGVADLRMAPQDGEWTDHTTTLMSGERAFVAAVHPTRRLLVAWIWNAADFPWLQDWQHYPKSGVLARGVEFSTQPFDVPRRQTVEMHRLMGAPAFRWLPARSTFETEFLVVLTTTPAGFGDVSSIDVADSVTLRDARGNQVSLPGQR